MLFDRVINIRFGFLLAVFIALWIAGFPNVSTAADYPTKPIQLIVPFGPGGGSDTMARLVINKMTEVLGQPVVIVNKPGGGGTLGTYAALGASPDGYTVIVISPTMASAPLITKNVTYNILRDFSTVNLSVSTPIVHLVRKEAPWQTLEELIAEAKKNPGKLTFSSPGYGGTQHLIGELFKMNTGTDFTHVPMDGLGPAVTAVLGGHISMCFADYGSVFNQLKAGVLRILAVNDPKRLKDFPEAPTIVEKGFPNVVFSSWQGFSVRSGTPKDIIVKLDKAIRKAFKDKDIIDKYQKTGWIVENLGTEEAADFIAKDYQKRMDVAKAAKITPR